MSKFIIFSIFIMTSNAALACSLLPLGGSSIMMTAVLTALKEDQSIPFSIVISVTKVDDTGPVFQVILRDGDGKISSRVYVANEKAGTFCGQFEAKLVN